MNPVDLMTIGFPAAIVILVLIGFYKVFVKKKSVPPFYTPFDEITGQSEVEFHEEREILAEDEAQGDKKNKRNRRKQWYDKWHSCRFKNHPLRRSVYFKILISKIKIHLFILSI